MTEGPAFPPVQTPEDLTRFHQLHGASWLRSNFQVELSDFGAKVAHLLDRWVDGIYHLSERALERVDWKHEQRIEISWHGGLSTYDASQLTRLVLLCHELCVRGEIEPCNPNHLRIRFSRRDRTGGLCEGHPTIGQVLLECDVRVQLEA
jgi:hypothetical protein